MLLIYTAKLPAEPSSGLLTRYVLENPLPASIGLLLVAAIVGWLGLRDGTKSKLGVAGAAAALGVLIFALGSLITTAAEHGTRITEELVDRVIAKDMTGAMRLFTDDASVALGSPNNPGVGISYLRNGLDQISAVNIESNRINMLDGFTESSDVAIVHLGCWTTTGQWGGTPSKWHLKIERQPDGEWLVTKLTCISIANSTPSRRDLNY